MIKGVNKQVVEVRDTGSEYFESALFFVDPKYYGISESKLREKAGLAVSNAGQPPRSREKSGAGKLKKAVCLLLAAAAGSILTAGINIIFF